MAVNLSPIGGVAGQFFDNNGDPLTGGKIYTYAAGTTTPTVTFTSSTGGVPHTNPIILDAAGRVPGGEIWLTDGIQYKFVIKTSTDVQIGSYDNIIGINSNFVNYTNSQEIQTATAGQTVFTLTTMQYQPGTNSLSVFVDGVNQYGPGALYAYDETSSTVVTFSSGLHVGASVKFVTSAINASSYGDAEQISYTPAFTSAVTTNVEAKLSQYVSVKDFGATGNGVTNDTAAFVAAFATARNVFVPAGTYVITSGLSTTTTTGVTLYGEGFNSVLDFSSLASGYAFTYGNGTSGVSHCGLHNLWIKGGGGANGIYLNGGGVAGTTVNSFTNLVVSNFAVNLTTGNAWLNTFQNVYFSNATGISAVLGAATNNVLFDRCSFTGATQSVTVTNSEGVQFNSCEFANLTSLTGAAIALTQSQTTLVNPYFENITSSTIASVGIPGETTVKSSFIMTGGQVNITDPLVRLNTNKGLVKITGANCVTNPIKFYDNGGLTSALYTAVTPSEISATASGNAVPQFNLLAPAFYGNTSPPPYAVGGGVTFALYRDYVAMQTSITGRGITIGPSAVIGDPYTIALAIRGTAGNAFLTGVGGNLAIPGYPASSGNWTVQYIPVYASATSIALAMNNATDPIEIQLIAVIKGHCLPSFDLYQRPLALAAPAAPTVGTWLLGDIVSNSAPAGGQPKSWVCTVAGTPGTWTSTGNL